MNNGDVAKEAVVSSNSFYVPMNESQRGRLISSHCPTLKVQRIDKSVELPKYAKEGDAAFDLRSREEAVIEPGQVLTVATGIATAIPEGHVGLIWDRSGLAARHGIHTLAGVIDCGYRGEIGVVMRNSGTESFKVEKGMRIAQMIVQPFVQARFEEVQELDQTQRGATAFGSSGLH
ncbi:MAG: dUTP diphosphatase [Nanoarchaeota archaeon]